MSVKKSSIFDFFSNIFSLSRINSENEIPSIKEDKIEEKTSINYNNNGWRKLRNVFKSILLFKKFEV